MILERGNMWDVWGESDLFLITTNPIVTKDGLAVMGRGIAKEAADRFPEARAKFGRKLSKPHAPMGYIGVFEGVNLLGYFMTKDHWRSPAKLEIIQASTDELQKYANVSIKTVSPGYFVPRIDLAFPGVGNGKLKREDVLPIIEALPDNVHVWEYA